MKKWIKRIGISIVVLIVAVIAVVYLMFQNEIATLMNMKKEHDYPAYTMTYVGDYGFDAFLEQGGASNDSELIDFVVKRLLKGIPLEFSIPNLGCSTFIAVTPEGDVLFGRNFDLSYSPSLIVQTNPKNGYASVSTVNLGFLGYNENKLPDSFLSRIISLAAPYAPLDGMNEAGLSIGVLLIKDAPTNQTTEKVDITTTTAIRLILDQAATVEEAVALLEQYDMHSSANAAYHFQIADAYGNSVVIEYVDQKMSIIYPEEEQPQAATNFLLTEGMQDVGGGHDRYEILIQTLTEKGSVLTEEEAMLLLQSVAQNKETSKTQWSVVYNLTDQTATYVIGMDYENPIVIQLKK